MSNIRNILQDWVNTLDNGVGLGIQPGSQAHVGAREALQDPNEDGAKVLVEAEALLRNPDEGENWYDLAAAVRDAGGDLGGTAFEDESEGQDHD